MCRYHCEFKKCNCNQFTSNSKLCIICNHANIWHSKKSKSLPKDGKFQFISSRKKTRRPQYTNDIIFAQIFAQKFTPEKIPIIEVVEIDPTRFCQEVCVLPV